MEQPAKTSHPSYSIYLLLLIFISTYSCETPPAEDGQRERLPNIIFIMADDLGYGDLGVYGQKVIQTPNLDQMAIEGMRFTQFYAGSPVCAPSRSVLLTGLHTGHTRVRGNFGQTGVVGLAGNPGRVPLKDEDLTIAEIMKKAGYQTGIAGKWGLGEPSTPGVPWLQGFDEFFGYLNQRRAHEYFPDYLWHNDKKIALEGNVKGQQKDYSHDLFTTFALNYIERNQDSTFFLYLPYTVPHSKYQIPNVGIYDTMTWTSDEKVHAAMVTRLDRDVGQIFHVLDSLGIAEQTIVFFCSDNGAAERWEGRFDSSGPLRGRKRDMYEGGIRSPFIIWNPTLIEPGINDSTMGYFADIFPTLAEIAQLKRMPTVDGKSLWPTIRKKASLSNDRYLYWEFHERGFQQAVRWKNWKVIRLAIGEDLQLFNLAEDPSEQQDVANQHPKLIKQFELYLSTARTKSADWPVEL